MKLCKDLCKNKKENLRNGVNTRIMEMESRVSKTPEVGSIPTTPAKKP